MAPGPQSDLEAADATAPADAPERPDAGEAPTLVEASAAVEAAEVAEPVAGRADGRGERDERPVGVAVARRDLLGGAAVVLGLVGVVSGKRLLRALSAAPTQAQCEALVARWVEHASRQRDPAVDDDDVAAARAAAPSTPEYVADLERCREQLTAEEVACAVEATYLDALERCVQ